MKKDKENTAVMRRKTQKPLNFIRQLNNAGLSSGPLTPAYSELVEGILTTDGTSTLHKQTGTLSRVVKTAGKNLRADIPSTDSIYTQCCKNQATHSKDTPAHFLLKH